jgi:hypothetical protein
MANETITPTIPTTGVESAPVAPASIIDEAVKIPPASEKSILDASIDEAGQAENKRILEADPKTLTTAEQITRRELEEAKKAEAAKGIPEKYDVKLPEGMEKDTGLLEKMTPVFKELGITGEAAQKLVDVYAPYVKAQFEQNQKSFHEAQEANFKNFLESERKATMDKLGANAKTDLVFAAKSRDRFLSKETQELLNAAGIANNFNFISDLIRMGKAISEDKLVEGRRITQSQKSDGEVLYGSSKEEK